MNKTQEKISRYVMRGEMTESEETEDIFEQVFHDSKEVASSYTSIPQTMVRRAAMVEWLLEHLTAAELDEWYDFEHVRVCEVCGKPMSWGWLVNGCDTYCSETCLHSRAPEDIYLQMCGLPDSDTYYTTWIE